MADFLLERGVKNVIIKAGSDGAFFKNAQEAFSCGCYKVPVADTTGAGDAFVAGYLAAMQRGFTPQQGLEFATACSAQVIQQVGATSGMKSFEEIMDFIRRSPKLEITRH